MREKGKLIKMGIIITGLGIFATPLSSSKLVVVFNMMAFVGLLWIGTMELIENKGLSIEDFDKLIDKQIIKGQKEGNYLKVILYTSIRPLIIASLAYVMIYSLYTLIFM